MLYKQQVRFKKSICHFAICGWFFVKNICYWRSKDCLIEYKIYWYGTKEKYNMRKILCSSIWNYLERNSKYNSRTENYCIIFLTNLIGKHKRVSTFRLLWQNCLFEGRTCMASVIIFCTYMASHDINIIETIPTLRLRVRFSQELIIFIS